MTDKTNIKDRTKMKSTKKLKQKANKKQRPSIENDESSASDVEVVKPTRTNVDELSTFPGLDDCSIEEESTAASEHPSATDASVSIAADNAFFLNIVNMIPPQHYFDEETNDDILEQRVASADQRTLGKKFRRGRDDRQAQLRRARYDPAVNQTVYQIRAHLDNANEKKSGKKAARHPADVATTAHLTSVEEAREKLHRRLEELKKNRTSVKKGDYAREKQKLKRQESKLRLKIRRNIERSHKTTPAAAKSNGLPLAKPSKPIFNKDGKIVYSKFDFTDSGEKERPKGEFTGKNYERLLAKVQNRNEKLQKLKEKNPEKAESLEEKIKWQSVLHRAEGIKVKDNPELLKKAMKLHEKKKKVQKKQWDERLDRTAKMMDDRQQKRRQNIKAQKQANIDRKVKKLKKKGRLIPGF